MPFIASGHYFVLGRKLQFFQNLPGLCPLKVFEATFGPLRELIILETAYGCMLLVNFVGVGVLAYCLDTRK